MRIQSMAGSVALALCVVLGACSSRPATADSAPSSPGAARRGAAPSLEQERVAQAQRDAAQLTQRTGVKLERVPSGAPKWFILSPGQSRSRAMSLEQAYQQATRNAASGDQGAEVAQAAYSRLATGEYVAWVKLKPAGAAPVAVAPDSAPLAAIDESPMANGIADPAGEAAPAEVAATEPVRPSRRLPQPRRNPSRLPRRNLYLRHLYRPRLLPQNRCPLRFSPNQLPSRSRRLRRRPSPPP
jgi:hypothetical protein